MTSLRNSVGSLSACTTRPGQGFVILCTGGPFTQKTSVWNESRLPEQGNYYKKKKTTTISDAIINNNNNEPCSKQGLFHSGCWYGEHAVGVPRFHAFLMMVSEEEEAFLKKNRPILNSTMLSEISKQQQKQKTLAPVPQEPKNAHPTRTPSLRPFRRLCRMPRAEPGRSPVWSP